MPDPTIVSGNAGLSNASSTEANLSDADLDAVSGGWCMPPEPAAAKTSTSMKANANTQNNLAAALKA